MPLSCKKSTGVAATTMQLPTDLPIENSNFTGLFPILGSIIVTSNSTPNRRNSSLTPNAFCRTNNGHKNDNGINHD